MYNYYNPYNIQNKNLYGKNNDERFVGGFAFPFLLGGVTGAAIAPAFWNNNQNNAPGYFVPSYPAYPVYRPYYYPRRWF